MGMKARDLAQRLLENPNADVFMVLDGEGGHTASEDIPVKGVIVKDITTEENENHLLITSF